MQTVLAAAAVFVASFLLGSIPWGVIISKAFYHTDIREHGSGNIGTTNALRTMGKAGGAAVSCSTSARGSLRAAWRLRRAGCSCREEGFRPNPSSPTISW